MASERDTIKCNEWKSEIHVCSTWDLTLVAQALNYVIWVEFTFNYCVVASTTTKNELQRLLAFLFSSKFCDYSATIVSKLSLHSICGSIYTTPFRPLHFNF